MDYVIKIDKNFIGYDAEGRYGEVNSINKAIRGNLHRLSNIVNNSISPSKRSQCKVVAFSTVKEVPSVVAPKHTEEGHTESMFDSVFAEIKKVDLTSFHKEHSELSQRMSRIDQEVSDIQHYIEFNRLNAADGYKAFKLLQDKLLERRVIKDDLAKFQMLAAAKVSDIYDGTFDKHIAEFESRTYTPRFLTHLFD